MFFRKRLSGLDAKIKKTAVGVLLVAIVAGSVFAGTSLRAGAYSKTQDVLNELLGAAKPYGVVAEEFKNGNHNQTCFATNKLVITDQWMSAWLDMSVGTTYIKSFDNSGSSEKLIPLHSLSSGKVSFTSAFPFSSSAPLLTMATFGFLIPTTFSI